MIDSNIPMSGRPVQIESPVSALGRAAAVQGLMNANRSADMKMQSEQRALDDDNKARDIVSRGGGEQELMRAGLFTQAQTFAKHRLDADKTRIDTESKQFELYKSKFDQGLKELNAVKAPEDAQAWLANQVKRGVLGMQDAIAWQRGIPADPAGFGQWRSGLLSQGLSYSDHLTNEWRTRSQVENERHNRAVEEYNRRMAGVAEQNANNPRGVPMESAAGLVLVDPRSGTSRPVTGADGRPVPARQPEFVRKEATGINSQLDIIDQALVLVKKTPSAFGAGRGAMTMGGTIPEAVAQRFDSDEEQVARSQVFNIVSKAINERAGAAQSAQELARLRGFLPGDLDDARTVENKLNGFKAYLQEQGKAYGVQPRGGPKQITSDAEYNALPSGTQYVAPDGSVRTKR